MKDYISEITGHLDIFVADNEDGSDGKVVKWRDVLIHGDPEGLKSFANLLLKLAEANQGEIQSLPNDARKHIHLRPNFELSKSSNEVIVGRLDAKATGLFYSRYIPKDPSLLKFSALPSAGVNKLCK